MNPEIFLTLLAQSGGANGAFLLVFIFVIRFFWVWN